MSELEPLISILPPCPACGEDDLWRTRDIVTVSCRECGWSSGALGRGVTPKEADALIAAAIEERKAKAQP